MRHRTIVLLCAGIFGALVAGFLIQRRLILMDWNGKPTCHKNLTFSFRLWMHEFADHGTKSNEFPNVEGKSRSSLLAASNELGGMLPEVITNYNYVPGLLEGDPAHLVLMYFNRPTRWRLHVAPEPVWREKSWIVVPLDNPYGSSEDWRKRIGHGKNQRLTYGELSESLTTEQFTNRLIATLDFLRTNERPNWSNVVQEHRAFIKSLPRK